MALQSRMRCLDGVSRPSRTVASVFACRQATHGAASCSYSPAHAQPARRQHRQRSRICAQAELVDARPVNPDEYFEVDKIVGIRANLDGEVPVVEYRVRWKDGDAETWEVPSNLSPDLVRDYDERWWNAARKGDAVAMREMLAGGAALLAQVVDENRRSALHFVAAVGAVPCLRLLLAAGADLDLQDREGYAPLHMAAGYMQTEAMQLLLEAGADPQLKDGRGLDVVALVDGLRGRMPVNPAMVQRRLALEQVGNVLTQRLYEEVAPAAILAAREVEGRPGDHEFLVQFRDERADEWLPGRDMDPGLVEDWEAGLEAVPASRLLDMRPLADGAREYLVEWADGADDCWVPEEQVSQGLVDDLAARRPELFAPKAGGEGGGAAAGGAAAGGRQSRIQGLNEQPEQQQQQQQQQPQQGGGNGSGNGNGAAAASNGQAAAAATGGGAKEPAGALRS